MKLKIFFLLSLATLFLFVSCNIGRKKGECSLRFTIETQNNSSGTVSSTMDIIRERLKMFDIDEDDVVLGSKNGRIELSINNTTVDLDKASVRELVSEEGNFEMWETYENSEMFPLLVKIDAAFAPGDSIANDMSNGEDVPRASAPSSIAITPLFSLLSPAVTGSGSGQQLLPGPILGYALPKDTAKIMSMFNDEKVKLYLPRDLRFAWSIKGDKESGRLELIALKSNSSGKAYFSGNTVTSAKVEETSFEPGYYSISIEMNAEAARMWKRMTGNNIGKAISVLIDDRVYCSPVVQSEIEGGRSMISGSFTKDEAMQIAAMLKSGKLPSPTRIVSESSTCP
jgi:SecD/SecF fusion protein